MESILLARLAGTRPAVDPVGEAAARLRAVFPVDDWLAARDPRPAAVLIGVVDRPARPGILLTRRTEDLADHAGQIAFPGGRLEASDPDPATAALRETEEEVGLPRSAVRVLGYLPPHLTLTGFVIQPVVGLIDPDVPLRPDPKEVAEVFELPWDILMDQSRHEQEWRDIAGRRVALPVFHHQGHRIWGATAMLLRDLHTALTRTP